MNALSHEPIAKFTKDGCMARYDEYDDALKLAIRETGARNMLIEQRLRSLLEKLEERGISPIVMKGCHLIQGVYPFGIRPIEDIDVLLDRGDFAEADAVVRSLGYESQALSMDVWTHVEVSNKVTYVNNTGPMVPIDFHFRLGPYPYLGRIPFHVLREHSQEIAKLGPSLFGLRPEMLLVHLCLHLFQHHDEHWEVSAYDLCTVTTLYKDTLDWNLFVSIVKEYSLQLPVAHALAKASSITSAQVPAWLLAELTSIPASWKERRIFQASLSVGDGFERHVIQFLTLPQLRVQLQCLRRILFPQRSFLHRYYNGNYGSYLLNMVRTTARALLRAVR